MDAPVCLPRAGKDGQSSIKRLAANAFHDGAHHCHPCLFVAGVAYAKHLADGEAVVERHKGRRNAVDINAFFDKTFFNLLFQVLDDCVVHLEPVLIHPFFSRELRDDSTTISSMTLSLPCSSLRKFS